MTVVILFFNDKLISLCYIVQLSVLSTFKILAFVILFSLLNEFFNIHV